MRPYVFRTMLRVSIVCGAALSLLATGCNNKVDNSANFSNAINTYYSAHPSCLWTDPIKFPLQVDTSDTSKTSGYDALVDQGLLVRTSAEKTKLIISTKQVNIYDLSGKGRTVWTVDVAEPGFGNFCYGHRKVSSIDSSTPTSSKTGATTQVTYHYTLADVPEWASAAETQNAYPQIRTDVSDQQSTHASLTNTSAGWQVTSADGTSTAPADGKIVE